MDKIVAIRCIHTSKQLADIVTNVLTPMVHEQVVSLLGMYCDNLKTIEFGNEKEREVLVTNGVEMPLKCQSCVDLGEKDLSFF
jgi:hypothetical protein